MASALTTVAPPMTKGSPQAETPPPLATAASQVQSATSAPTPPSPAPTGNPPAIDPRRIKVSLSAAAPEPAPRATDSPPTTAPQPVQAASKPIAVTDATTPHLPEFVAAPTGQAPAAERPADAAPASPTVQIAQAAIPPLKAALAENGSSNAAAPDVLTIQLDPLELGRVEIRIERPNDGPAKIHLAAERPETLQRLVDDQSQLRQALDQAGIPSAGRTIEFSLSTGNPPSGSSASASADANGQDGRNGGSNRSQNGYPAAPKDSEPIARASTALASARSGIDITA